MVELRRGDDLMKKYKEDSKANRISKRNRYNIEILIIRGNRFLIANSFFGSNKIYKKGKVIPLHAMEELGVRGGVAPTHS
jgi:hypothetical protein